jgi:hypothetical protein
MRAKAAVTRSMPSQPISSQANSSQALPSPEQPEEASRAPLLREKRRRFSLFILLAGIFVFVAAAGALYFALRPDILRIAVGPSGSDDQKLVQALA